MQPRYESRPYVTAPDTITGDDWLTQAACVGHDPETWFPHDTDKDGIAVAVNICGTCPVIDACLKAAIDREGTSHAAARSGIWGGLTPQQRFNLHKRRSRHQARSQP